MDQHISELITKEKFDDAYTAADEYLEQNDFESAHEVYDEIYEAVCEKYGRSSEKAYVALRGLADLDYEYGDYDEAMRLYNMYLDYVKENYNIINTDYYDISARVATMLEYYGEFEEALNIRSEILNVYLSEYGENSIETVRALGGLGWNKYMSGNNDEAKELFLQQYQMALDCDECDDKQYYYILQNLGRAYQDMYMLDEALKYLDMAYETAVRAYGEKSPGALSVLNDLSGIYEDNGRLSEALELKEKVYETAKEILGENAQDTVMSKLNLGSCYRKNGNYEKSLELTKEAYEWYVENMGEEYHNTLLAMNNLAGTYSSLGENEKALELSEKVYSLSVKTLGELHTETLGRYINVSFVYNDMDMTSNALEIADDICGKLRDIPDNDPSTYLFALTVKALFHYGMEQYDEVFDAVELYRKTAEKYGYDNIGDNEHLHNLSALSFARTGKYREAYDEWEKNITISEKLYGRPDHPSHLRNLSDGAYIYYKAGDHEKALDMIMYVIDMLKKHGTSTPKLSDAELLYSDILIALGRYDKAEEILVRLIADEPDNDGVYYTYAHLYTAEDRIQEAVRMAEKGLELTKYTDPLTYKRKRFVRLMEELKR
ncbi:MAG: tetratricopeptide repeat protein [Ruminococcus sp.]|nr:tetratricopeptide repeat protein [Ruminococcus sp.]